MKVDISIGELFDKITILKIKKNKIQDSKKLQNVEKELDILVPLSTPIALDFGDRLDALVENLADVNLKLWDVEDKLRILEKDKDFGSEFIELARSVYFLNDKRAVIKKEINLMSQSEIVEEKDYVQYS
jgi:predicted secreted acid phosphatase